MGIFNRHRHLRPDILSEYLDGRLDQRHLGLVDRRLADCPVCREELATLQATVSTLQSLPDLPLPRSFTLPTAPSLRYPANLIRKPDPLLMKMPGWVYGGAASLAGLALALLLSAEAAGLASPASFQASAAPEEDAAAQEAQVGARVESPAPALGMAEQAQDPAGSQAAKRPPSARQSKPAPAAGAAADTEDSALAANILTEPAGPAPEMADQPPTPAAFQEDQPLPDAHRAIDAAPLDAADDKGDSAAAAKSGAEPTSAAPLATRAEGQTPADIISAPAPEDAAADTASDPAAGDAATDTASDAAAKEAAAFTIIPGDDGASLPKDSAPAVTAEDVPATPAKSAQSLTTEAETPDENLNFPAEQYPALSSPTWWKALEIVFAALALAFLGGLFFRWQRYRSRPDV